MTKAAMTAEEFELSYARGMAIDVAQLHANGRFAEPCACDYEACQGWILGYQWEDAIVEDRVRAAAQREPA